MSQAIRQVQCPRCNARIQARVQQVINARQDPAGKAQLLSGSLNLLQCDVCQYEGHLATPVVYHDPDEELLLTFVPPQLGLSKDEQERQVGRLINQIINGLPKESRKGYLLQPQTMLTMESMIERVLGADGITKEDIEAQRERMRLFEELIRAPAESFDQLVAKHDSELDAAFFQLASLSVQAVRDQQTREAASERLGRALELTTFGKSLQKQEEAFQAASDSLRQAGEAITREKLLELILEAPDDDRVTALASLARPGLDYTFFQQLTDRIDKAEGEEKERFTSLRQKLLAITEEIDQIQEARARQAASLLRSLMQAEDLDSAMKASLPLVDETFFGILQANLRAAEEQDDSATLERLQEIDKRLREILDQALPPGLHLARELQQIEEEKQALAMLEASQDRIDEHLLNALMKASQDLAAAGQEEQANLQHRLYRAALRLSMRQNMASPAHTASAATNEADSQ